MDSTVLEAETSCSTPEGLLSTTPGLHEVVHTLCAAQDDLFEGVTLNIFYRPARWIALGGMASPQEYWRPARLTFRSGDRAAYWHEFEGLREKLPVSRL